MGKSWGKRKRVNYEEKEAEDWCFVCKDGGDLIICDHKNCGKVYHSDCIGEDHYFPLGGKPWICGLHYCFNCKKPPKFYCIGCPDAACKKCFGTSTFAIVRGEKALCIECLELVQIAEKNLNQDSQGNEVYLNDRNTYEALFKEYWDIIKVKEGLTNDDVSAILTKYEKVRNSVPQGRCNGCEDEIYSISSDSDTNDLPQHKPWSKRKSFNSLEFIGWGSKPIIGFLKSIGKDITQPLTQLDVSSLISEYLVRKDLQHPKYKNKFLLDENLFPIFRKKVVSKNKIYSLLEAHFAVNLDHSDEENPVDEKTNNSADKHLSGQTKCVETRLSSLIRKPLIKKGTPCTRASPFASICTKNITLVYLRQSLVQELSATPDIFESKVIGSFVKVKKKSNECPQENSQSLVLVTGITKGSTSSIFGPSNDEFLLQVSFVPAPIPISKLSDSDITEEECKELQQNVENGLLEKLTVVKLEEKARSLHEDITKHWIARELVNLQRRIDRANLNGWTREKEAFINEKVVLEKPWKQEQLLQRQPYVYPEIIMSKYDSSQDYPETGKQECFGSPQSVLQSNSESPAV